MKQNIGMVRVIPALQQTGPAGRRINYTTRQYNSFTINSLRARWLCQLTYTGNTKFFNGLQYMYNVYPLRNYKLASILRLFYFR